MHSALLLLLQVLLMLPSWRLHLQPLLLRVKRSMLCVRSGTWDADLLCKLLCRRHRRPLRLLHGLRCIAAHVLLLLLLLLLLRPRRHWIHTLWCSLDLHAICAARVSSALLLPVTLTTVAVKCLALPWRQCLTAMCRLVLHAIAVLPARAHWLLTALPACGLRPCCLCTITMLTIRRWACTWRLLPVSAVAARLQGHRPLWSRSTCVGVVV